MRDNGVGSYAYLFIFFLLAASSCTIIRKAPPGKHFLVKNTIKLEGGKFSKIERSAVISRLYDQLDDSSKFITKEALFIFHTIVKPPAYDSLYSAASARSMKGSMYHLGYYDSEVSFKADTSGRRVKVNYLVRAGNPTIIDTLVYRLDSAELQDLARRSSEKSVLLAGNPVTRAGVLGEISRLVDTFRNNGYYKFTAAELKVRGDTSIAALTSITDDPFTLLELISEAERLNDSPRIKLSMVINPPSDSSKLHKYFINRITVYPDFYQGDVPDGSNFRDTITAGIPIRYHQPLFKPEFLVRNVAMRGGEMYRHALYYKTINNFAKAGVWESINIRMEEDSLNPGLVDVSIELLPGKKFGFEAALEASYSANSNTNNALAGNLFGISGNLSLTNRNMGREAIKMIHSLRAGIELNNNYRAANTRLINAQEISYSNNVIFPRLVTPFNLILKKPMPAVESFLNTNIAVSKRLDLFNTQAFNLNYGINVLNKKGWRWTFKPVNIEFNYLYNQTDSFNRILDSIPFLRYSYNTALITGMSGGLTMTYRNPKHLRSIARERTIKLNVEESGLTWGALLPAFKKYRRRYVRADAEYKYTVTYRETELAFRLFSGVGIAVGNDTTLPFFKQYFSGGSNGMRAWPIRGVGRGSQKLVPFGQNVFNDRTADMQLEANAEYRYIIARIIPNTLTLRGAVFIDAGNIWNLRNSRPDGSPDSAQFKFKNLYKELGVAAGTGFRLDFNYFVLRLDLGFRFKRPELSNINNGWKTPDIGFDDLLPKLFGRKPEYRQWRYENFNFTIGISYPF